MSKISVIIPVYNTEEFIEKCIESVINQSYNDIEIILINDCSTDNSLQKISNLQKEYSNITIFNFDNNRGVGAARNHGINHATGDYIYFLDSDDYLPETTLEILVNNIKDHNIIRGRMKSTNLSNSFVIAYEGLFNVKYFTENRFN